MLSRVMLVRMLALALASFWLLLYLGYFHRQSSLQPRTDAPALRRLYLPLLLVVLCCYAALALLLSFSWISNDDWSGLICGELDLLPRIRAALAHYRSWVSRGGEFIAHSIGLSPSGWEKWLVTPLFAVAAPFCMFKLVQRPHDSLHSVRGISLYLALLCLCLTGVYLPSWRNYWCFMAAYNYLYPTVATMYLLSFFRTDAVVSAPTKWRCSALFALGLYSGWGTECATATLLPLLTLWVLYHICYKTRQLSPQAYCGYFGFLWGALLLFCSPALRIRSVHDTATAALQIKDLSAAQLTEYLHSLTWDSVNLLRGCSSVISFKGIPLTEHYHFLPFIGERFISCCIIGILVWLITALSFALLCRRGALRPLLVSSAILALGFICALSYLAQCIPTPMSFLPPCFIIVLACAYLLVRHRPAVVHGIAALLLLFTGSLLVPAGIQAARNKKYDRQRLALLQSMKEQGQQDIVLPPWNLTVTCPDLGLMSPNDLKANPQGHPNTAAAGYFQVRSIAQEQADNRQQLELRKRTLRFPFPRF